MIASAGSIAGIVFGIVLNLWMVRSFEMVRMNNSWTLVGAVVIFAAEPACRTVASAARRVHTAGARRSRRLTIPWPETLRKEIR